MVMPRRPNSDCPSAGTHLQPRDPADFSTIRAVEVQAKSDDGTMIPFSILMRTSSNQKRRKSDYSAALWAFGACH
jgi:hypothetical protein